jgi:hypothetical protein
MSAELIAQRGKQTRKITLLRVSAGLRPSLEIVLIFTTIQQQLHVWLLSKNAMHTQKPSLTLPFIQVNQSQATT